MLGGGVQSWGRDMAPLIQEFKDEIQKLKK